ncbi:ATP-grasp domain-containing protein [Kitasatospora sp. NPDC001660]
MRFLVLNRTPLSGRRFPDWLGEEHQAVLLTDSAAVSPDEATRRAQLAGYHHVELVDDFSFNPQVELTALDLHRRFGFERVIALSEFDILRAARLRGLFGVPGQDAASATAFRDKLTMKRLLAQAGVPLAPFAPLAHLADLLGFVETHGYPVVVKPRTGGGSMGVRVLHGEDDLAQLAADHRELGTDDGAHLLVERHLEHELFHVDGLIAAGEPKLMWPSSQGTTSCLGIMAGQALHSSLLDGDDPRFTALRELTTRALAALPVPETFMFHAEVFGTAEHGLVFNEVASRMGGGNIEYMLQAGFDVILPEVYVRSLVGNEPPAIPSAPLRSAGLALLPPRPGVLAQIPAQCPVPGIDVYQPAATPGTVLTPATNSVEKIAFLLASGTTRAEVDKALAEATEWFDANTVITPLPDPAP